MAIAAGFLGIYTPYGNYTYYTSSKENRTKVRNWYLGPQIRYYHPVSRKLYFLVEAQGGVNFEIMKNDYTVTSPLAPGEEPSPFPTKSEFMIEEKESKENALSFQTKISPGIVYFLDSKIALEFKANLFDHKKVLNKSEAPFWTNEVEDQASKFRLAKASVGTSIYF